MYEFESMLLLQQCVLLSYSFVTLNDHPYYDLVGVTTVPLTVIFIFSLMTTVLLQRRKLMGDRVDIAKLKQERQDKFKATTYD